MIKAEMQRVRLVNFQIRHPDHSVDRGAGGSAYAVAVQRLREELVGISRGHHQPPSSSGFKRGPPEWHLEADVPVCRELSGVLSGSWTKDHQADRTPRCQSRYR